MQSVYFEGLNDEESGPFELIAKQEKLSGFFEKKCSFSSRFLS